MNYPTNPAGRLSPTLYPQRQPWLVARGEKKAEDTSRGSLVDIFLPFYRFSLKVLESPVRKCRFDGWICFKCHVGGSYRTVATLKKRQGNIMEIREKRRYLTTEVVRVFIYRSSLGSLRSQSPAQYHVFSRSDLSDRPGPACRLEDNASRRAAV